MPMPPASISVCLPETLTITELETIVHLWNSEYPAILAYKNVEGLKNYLNGLDNAIHYFLSCDGAFAWSLVFTRENETWFVIIVDRAIQGKGVGKQLLTFVQGEHPEINGWVIDEPGHVKMDGSAYSTPLKFYLNIGFRISQNTQLILPQFKAVKIMSQAPTQEYLFRSERLGFRTWRYDDHAVMSEISGDAEVMAYFPSVQDRTYVLGFIERMKKEFREKAYCYFAVDLLETRELIGFIGLHEQTFASDFTPCVDIGWRLKKEVWNQGYATEGATRCLRYAFEILNLTHVYSITPKVNVKSQRIMQKIGMTYCKTFEFEMLKNDARFRDCVLYRIA